MAVPNASQLENVQVRRTCRGRGAPLVRKTESTAWYFQRGSQQQKENAVEFNRVTG